MNKITPTIAKANTSHIDILKKLWKDGFGDDEKYIDFFFANKFSDCIPLVVLNKDIAIGAAYLMPVSTYEFSKFKKGYYAYAITISPEYRKLGFGKFLIEAMCSYATDNNKFIILCPADEKLCDYYASCGFIENAYITRKIIYPENKFEKMDYIDLDTTTFKQLRDKCFEKNIIWDSKSLKYVISENKITHGQSICITHNRNKYYLIMHCHDDYIEIKESNVPYALLNSFTNFLCNKFGGSYCAWSLPYKNSGDEAILYGMSYNLQKDNYYLNLILN